MAKRFKNAEKYSKQSNIRHKEQIREVEEKLDGIVNYYDPPSGWRYGFPKIYKPLEGESLAETLKRDGYPQKLIDDGMNKHVRFWSTKTFSEDEYTGYGP